MEIGCQYLQDSQYLQDKGNDFRKLVEFQIRFYYSDVEIEIVKKYLLFVLQMVHSQRHSVF